MNCKETATFMDGYLDGELDLVRSVELERHLLDCAACSELHGSRVALRSAAGAAALRYQPPAGLEKSVRAALSALDREERKPAWRIPLRLPAWTPVAAMAAILGVFAILWLRPPANPLEHDVVEAHIRSLMANHLTDVTSTDQHTVKPWFAGKVDFSPPVRDFSSEGFRLIGGRLDYLDSRPVAALVYQRNQHVINVFTWPVQDGNHGIRSETRQGYNILDMVQGHTEYWLVSDLNAAELRQLADLILRP